MPGIATYRLHLLRGGYLLPVFGLGFTVWPQIVDPAHTWEQPRRRRRDARRALAADRVIEKAKQIKRRLG